jgi:hypothetical protein
VDAGTAAAADDLGDVATRTAGWPELRAAAATSVNAEEIARVKAVRRWTPPCNRQPVTLYKLT